MVEIDRFISYPQKYELNAVARVIQIKTEADIKRYLGIKIERKNSVDHNPQKKSAARM